MPNRRKTTKRKAKAASFLQAPQSYPSYAELASAIFQAKHKRHVDTVVLKSAFYLVIPMDVWVEHGEHYTSCEVMGVYLK